MKLLSAAMLLLIGLGCLWVAFGFAHWYIVASGAAVPGEPITPDDLALEPRDALRTMALGVALIAGAGACRAWIRSKKRTRTSTPGEDRSASGGDAWP